MTKSYLLTGMMLALMAAPAGVKAQDAYAVEKDGVLTFYYDGNRNERAEGNLYNVDTELAEHHHTAPRWCQASLTKVVFDDSFAGYTFVSAAYMFSGCTNLAEVENMEALNTAETTTFNYMFENCKSLSAVDLSSLNTSKVEGMDGMFYRCASLESLDLSGLDTRSLTSMFFMFSQSGLKSVCLDGLNTSKVESFHSMFSSCSAVEEIDLSSCDTSAASDMSSMFSLCSSLKTICVGDGWNLANVTNGQNMFFGCMKLVGQNGTKCDGFINVDYDWAYVDSEATPGYLTYKAPAAPSVAYAVADGDVLTFYYDSSKSSRTGTVYDIEASYVGDGNFPAWRGTACTKVVFDASFAVYQPTSTARWFHSCSAITAFEGMANLNTSQSTSMSGMFYGCKGLKELDLSSLDTSSATSMATMFYECSGLESLDLSSFDTRNVMAMTAMFYGCKGLKELNVSSFDTRNVQDMQYMFFCCGSLSSLDVSSFNTEEVTNMERMFSAEEQLGVLGNLTRLDLSSFNTSKVTNMTRMFQDNVKLAKIYVSDLWSTASVTEGEYMFFGCLKLVGGAGTVCNGILNTDHTYAHIDAEDAPGYFTLGVQGIADVTLTGSAGSGRLFSIDGRPIVNPTKGIYIENGKKRLKR